MYNGHVIAVVVPAHNEEALVGRTIATVPSFVDHLIVVDDGSTDRTAERAGMAARGRPGFSLEVHPWNRGVGAAISTGYRRALQVGADVAVVVGGDAQMDPRDMPQLIDALIDSDADYAKGDRLTYPGVSRVMPASRLVGNIALTALTRLASGYWSLRDSQCGYTAAASATLRRLDLDRVYPRYGYPNDVLARLGEAGLKVVDVPVRPIYATERSGIRIHRIVLPLLVLIAQSGFRRLWARRVSGVGRLRRPLPRLV